ncbi:MAG: hypothetical protein ACO1TE_25640 [Prosthecobacter sp.]
MRISSHRLVILTLAAVACLRAQDGASRPWKDVQGRIIQAAFIRATAEAVTLRMADGKEHDIPLSRLCAEDQAFVRSQAALKPALAPATAPTGAAAAPDPARVPIDKRVWPQNVVVPTRSIEIQPVEESAPARRFVYQSEAFQFTSQAKLAGSVMKEVARTFEATRALVTALPWGVVCRPPEGMERYQAALFETRNDYINAGGPQNSGGVYMTGEKIFKVPFPSIGLEMRGKTWFKNDNYSGDTLIHEITHQMMHDYLPFLPVWVIEGTAEYTEMLPYNAGTFRADSHKGAIRDHINEMQKRGYSPSIANLQTHMTMNRGQWSGIAESSNRAMGELYFRSVLAVYFFCHLDGDKKGTRFMKFMDAVHGETEALRTFFKDPRVKRHPDGSFTYPTSFPPPDMKSETGPFKHLTLLLNDRSYSQIAQEMVAAYKDIGLKVSVN